MCMEPDEVVKLIRKVQEALENESTDDFKESIESLADQIKKVIFGGVDMDALVHSFL